MIAAVLVDRAAICCLLCFYALRCRSVVFLCSGYGFKYLLQRTFPCSQSLFHCNFYIPIGKHCIIFYFTNNQLIQAFGGTSILIMIGVALDTMSKVESQLKMYNYEGFFK